MIRALPLLVLLGACATMASAPLQNLRGCWIERRGEETLTMRWFPAAEGWRGDLNSYLGGDVSHQAFRLTPGEGGWEICPLDDGLSHGPPCRPAYFGLGQPTEAGADWMEIEAGPDALRFSNVVSGARAAVFDGARDGCD
ncbi:MAG: hypothetical protein AB7O04_03255 [Hyphomonadaceae bacterium]